MARLNLAATSMGIPVYQWKLLYIDAVLTAISAHRVRSVSAMQTPQKRKGCVPHDHTPEKVGWKFDSLGAQASSVIGLSFLALP